MLLQIALPEILILKLPTFSFPDIYLRAYFEFQEHFHLGSLLARTVESLGNDDQVNHIVPTKLFLLSRTSNHVAQLSSASQEFLGEVSSICLIQDAKIFANKELASQVLPLLEPLIQERGSYGGSRSLVRRAAAESLGRLTNADPTLATQTLCLLEHLAVDQADGVSGAAVKSLITLAVVHPHLTGSVVSKMSTAYDHFNSAVSIVVADSIAHVITEDPKMAFPALLPLLYTLAQDASGRVRKAAGRALMVIKPSPDEDATKHYDKNYLFMSMLHATTGTMQ